MKKHFFNAAFWAFLSLAFLTTGCSDDDGFADVDGQSPTMSFDAHRIQTALGRDIMFTGSFADADGISTIQLQCPDLHLNKTIDLIEIYGEPQTEYNLTYTFAIPDETDQNSFTVGITVTDVGGRAVSDEYQVTLDGDFSDPIFTAFPDDSLTVLIKAETGCQLEFSVNDDRALKSVTIDIPGVEGFPRVITSFPSVNSYTFSERISLPSTPAIYDVMVTAVDTTLAEKTIADTCHLVVQELPDFEKMYLADTQDLNSDVFGVPMCVDHVGEFQYRARYYNQNPNTEIFFLPQTSSFSPICFGLDPTDENKLADDPSISEPIVLTEANVYYEITFNTKEGTYAISTYSIADAQDPWNPDVLTYGEQCFDLWGDGGEFIDFTFGLTSTDPTGVKSFVQDAVNPHLFYSAEPLELEAGEEMNFIIHNYHTSSWWNMVRWCSISDKDLDVFGYYTQSGSQNPAYDGPTNTQDVWSKPIVTTTGSYRFYFDSHLGRAKLVRE